MKQFTYTITDEVGIHARPAGLLVKAAKGFSSKVMIQKDGKSVDVKKLMALMGLGVKCGDTVEITVEGEDEAAAAEALEAFFKENL
ncbi:MAG TPA: HPr family phosphocarrier protein [Candidatus Blautia gallistercoris]|uniref:HPr family phosphocarrier protein n=1 Tax=Candidatus Blautia gallistercoris TaxID=2838490 RepID=A0A9D1WI07_9FIRM|nr:HPr family phosphocarrier protein [Candidatus Blautia gallistercoris]